MQRLKQTKRQLQPAALAQPQRGLRGSRALELPGGGAWKGTACAESAAGGRVSPTPPREVACSES